MYLCLSDFQCHLKPLCIVMWKHSYPCMALCMCSSHLISVPTPWIECVHASVHVFMSILLPILAWPLLHSYMETWVPLCTSVCVCPSHPTSGHTPWFKCTCTCISTWIYVHLIGHICSTPMHSLMEIWVTLYVSVFVSQSHYFYFPTLIWMCTCISTCIYVHMTPHVSSSPCG